MDLVMKIVRLVAGIALLVGGVVTMGVGNVIFALPLFVIGAILLYSFIAEPLGALAAGAIFSRNAAELPEQFSHVKALVSNSRYEEALVALDQMIQQRPDLTAARIFKARLLYEHLNRGEEALAVATKVLAQNDWQAEHETAAMIAVDIFLEQNRRQEAANLLRAVLPRIANRQQRGVLEQRLASLTA